MTANVNDVVVVVVCFFDVTKPASICNHKKFRNHDNVSFQNTLYSLIGSSVEVLISLYYSNIRMFSVDKIRQRIRLSAAAWGSTRHQTHVRDTAPPSCKILHRSVARPMDNDRLRKR